MFLPHNNLSSVISIHHRCRFHLHDSDTLAIDSEHDPDIVAIDFEQVIVTVICFLVICFLPCLLTRYWFVSCQQHMCHRFCLLCIYGVLADWSLFRYYCIWHCLLTRNWFVQCQQHLYIGVILQYNSGSVAAFLNKTPFQYICFSLGYCVFTSF